MIQSMLLYVSKQFTAFKYGGSVIIIEAEDSLRATLVGAEMKVFLGKLNLLAENVDDDHKFEDMADKLCMSCL